MGKTKFWYWIIKKVPFGIIAGACAIVVFYAIVGFVAAHVLFSSIAAQTAETVSPFENWWQGLIFAGIIVFSIIFLASTALFILKKTLFKKKLGFESAVQDFPAEDTAANESAISQEQANPEDFEKQT